MVYGSEEGSVDRTSARVAVSRALKRTWSKFTHALLMRKVAGSRRALAQVVVEECCEQASNGTIFTMRKGGPGG